MSVYRIVVYRGEHSGPQNFNNGQPEVVRMVEFEQDDDDLAKEAYRHALKVVQDDNDKAQRRAEYLREGAFLKYLNDIVQQVNHYLRGNIFSERLEATVEYPGYIHLDGFNFGTANGYWGADATVSGTGYDLGLATTTPAADVACAIYTFWSDVEFRIRCREAAEAR